MEVDGKNPVRDIKENDEFKEVIKNLANIFFQADGEIWNGKKDYYVYTNNFNLQIDLGGIKIGGKEIPKDD